MLARAVRLAVQPVLWSPRTGAEVRLVTRGASLAPGDSHLLRWLSLARYIRLVRFHGAPLAWRLEAPAIVREVRAVSIQVDGNELLGAPVTFDRLSRHPIPFDSPPIRKNTTITLRLERRPHNEDSTTKELPSRVRA